MNKKVIYTAIIGDYDTLKEPLVKTKGWDYICFTDQDLKSDTWKIIKVGRSDAKEARRKKIYNEYIFNEYELSIWVDASMYVNCDLDAFKSLYFESDFTLMKHPSRNCIYQEAVACLVLNKDSKEVINEQINKYQDEHLPPNTGMVATGVMIRKHTKEVIQFCREWWSEVFEHSVRDQLSFNYIAWKKDFNYHTIPFSILNKEFIITNHK